MGNSSEHRVSNHNIRYLEMNITNIDEIPLNKKILTLLQQSGITKLFPPQTEVFRTPVLEGKNLVLAIPTSSGKTLVAEICMLKAISEGKGKALYLVPLRSLAQEKHTEFKKYERLGIITAMSIGDFDSKGSQLSDADIIVLTTERADSIIRHQPEWMNDIGIIVIDEVHLVNDFNRGPTLEMVIAKLKHLLPAAQIIALSATISNADEIAGWLEGELVRSVWRPVDLKEGVYHDGTIRFEDTSERAIPRRRNDTLANLVCDIIDEDGQVLIFVSSRRSTVSVCRNLSKAIRPLLSPEVANQLHRIATTLNIGPSTPAATKDLASLMTSGIAFHHAGLSNTERALVEDGFRMNLLKAVVATPTLAAGVNLPARRVIIRDYRRFEQSRGSYPIPILEYKQMAGRAGRPKYDQYGESVLIAKTESEQDFLFEHYLQSEPEPISSKLASQRALQFHLLSAIATQMTQSRTDIDALLDGTFYSFQLERWRITHYVELALDYLVHGGLVQVDKAGNFYATALGQRASELYIDPSTAILFRDALAEADELSEIGLLHLMCHSDYQPVSYVARTEVEEIDSIKNASEDYFLVPVPDGWDNPEGYTRFLAELKTALVLLDWINEIPENTLTDRFNVGMGDVHRYVQSAEWLLYSASEIARVSNLSHLISPIQNLRSRIKHGVRSELLELVTLKGIGRIRARMLYNHGVKGLIDVHHVAQSEIARIPSIGNTLAVSIKKQVGAEVEPEPSRSPSRQLSKTHSDIQQKISDDY